MRKFLTILFSLLSLISYSQFSDIDIKVGVNSWDTRPAIIYVPASYASNPTKKYPLIFFFHGLGEASGSRNDALLEGTGLPQLIVGGQVPKAIVGGTTYEYIVVCPQHSYGGWGQDGTSIVFRFMLDDIINRYRIDQRRVYMTGLSAGGQSTIESVVWDTTFAKRIAAVYPISVPGLGYNQPRARDSIPAIGKRYHVKSWAVVGSYDTTLNTFINTRDSTKGYNNSYNSLSPSPLGTVSIITGGTHSSNTWNVAYDTAWRIHANNQLELNMYEWFAQYQSDSILPAPPELNGSKIPITTDYVWQDNSQQDKATKLVDGDTSSNYVPAPPIIYRPHEIVFDLWDWNARVTGIRYWIAFSDTTHVYVYNVRRSDGAETLIGTFTGGSYQHFVYYNTDSSNTSSKIILRCSGNNMQFGSEVELWGYYTAPITPTPKVRRPLGWMSGTVAHSYDLMNDAKLNKLKTLGLSNVRAWENAYDVTDYRNYWKFEPELGTDRYSTDSAFGILKRWKPSLYTWKAVSAQWTPQLLTWQAIDDFPNKYIKGRDSIYIDHGSWGEVWMMVIQVAQPTEYNIGRWYVYRHDTLLNITETPESFSASLVGQMRHYNVGGGLSIVPDDTLIFYKSQTSVNPIYWSANDTPIRNLDTSYLLDGQNMYVYATRGGTNASVQNYPLQTTSPAQRLLKGYGIYNAVEPANEPDAWWTTWLGFWNGKTVEHLMSMSYDGAKNIYDTTGAKQADSTIDVLLSGMATDKTDQIYGVIEEARKQRGYLSDGTINVPFDAINVHIYPSSGGQYGTNYGALPWELGARSFVRSFINLIERRAPHTKFYITEWGYDLNAGSPLHAGYFSSYDRETVASMWMVRAMLTMAVDGVDRSTYYTLFQNWPESSSNNDATQFATMRLLRQPVDANADSIVRSRQGDYMAQFNDCLANYTFSDSIETGYTYVHAYKYTYGDSTKLAIWSEETYAIVSDTLQFTERTGTVNLPIPVGSYHVRHFLDDGSAIMDKSSSTSIGTVNFNYAAKPIIIEYSQAIIPRKKGILFF